MLSDSASPKSVIIRNFIISPFAKDSQMEYFRHTSYLIEMMRYYMDIILFSELLEKKLDILIPI